MTGKVLHNLHSLVICTNIFVKKGNKYLVIRRSKQKLDFPDYIHSIGGKINTAEDPLVAAKRELKEEAGIEAKNIRLEAVVTENMHADHPIYKTPWLIFYFSSDYAQGKPIASDEGDLFWLTKEEILKEQMIPSLRLIVNNILNPHDGVVFARVNYDIDMNIIDHQVTVSNK